ncbi:MAG: GAF domain-containing protein, partial [Rubrobacteraceae bacterium]
MSGRGSTRLAWFLFALALLVLSVGVVLRSPDAGFFVSFALISAPFAFVGALVASRRPRNPIGWLFLVFSVVAAFVAFADRYARYALVEHPGSLAGAEWVAWVASGIWHPAFGFFVFAFLLFPDGHLPSPRWRPVAFIAAANYLMGAALGLLWGPLFKEFFPYADPPFRLPESSIADAAFVVFIVVNFGLLALSAVSLVLRMRRSSGVERQQLKWFVYAVALFALAFPPSVAYLGDGRIIVFLLPLVPAAAGVAILKYRLYDIDPIINRTLVYGALTASVVAVYIFIVAYLGVAFRAEGNLLISLVATSIVAIMFAPLRDLLQRSVNRLMYGRRDEPYSVLSNLGERLENALAPEAALATVAESVAHSLKLPHAEVALEHDGHFMTAARFGTPAGDPVVLPLTHHAEVVGRMVVSPRSPGEEFSPADRRLLADLARQAGSAAHAARLTADLKRSRERLVVAREEERLRLRRDLHDGLGPRLATLALKHDAAMN